MSDNSASAGVWPDALTRVLRPPLFPTAFRRRPIWKHVAVTLCGLVCLALTTQPLNLTTLRRPQQPAGVPTEATDARPARNDDAAVDQGEDHAIGEASKHGAGFGPGVADRIAHTGRPLDAERVGRMLSFTPETLLGRAKDSLAMIWMLIIVYWAVRKSLVIARHAARLAQCSHEMGAGTPAERRREPRVRTRFRRGVLYCGYNIVVDCAVVDRSEHGARIRTAFVLPALQRLRFFDTYERVMYEGRVAWQKDTEAGLELTRLFKVSPRRSASLRRH